MKIDDYVEIEEETFKKARYKKFVNTRLLKRKYQEFKHKIIVDEGLTIIMTISMYRHDKMTSLLRESRYDHYFYQHRHHPLKNPKIYKISDYSKLEETYDENF